MNQTFTLSHKDAMKIIASVQTELEKNKRGAAVAVTDEHGELIALLRTDGCPLASINNAIHKAFTAARERKESKEVGNSSKADGWPLTNFGDLRYIGWGGGVPIFYQGQVIGAVGVSGLPEEEDMVLARLGAAVLAE
ncbi:MAG: GlcG/HbpS family heme-binding protein [Aggregatilineales bacterium]